MGSVAVDADGRYWAFISYSHKDAVFGRRLHRRLEGYSLPRRLARADRTLPRRLTPIFRDREELPAAQDLSAEVRAALAQSRALIVVCSPAAAVSPWVAREIELFRELHPDRPILAAIREGDPKDAFPPSLRLHTATGEDIEPLAADFRKEHDGPELGLLKLVAGLLGVGLDELVRRDSQRQLRRVTAITVTAIVAMLVMTVLTAIALNARDEAERQRREAERQRGEAEGLVEFMLTDLRTTLKGVGRLDAMTAVNARALKYYSDQDLAKLPVESLERRARVLHAMGEDDEGRGNYDAALKMFEEASRTTATLWASAPNEVERVFDHAQSEYWLGYHYYAQRNYAAARPHFEGYKRLADLMIELAPHNPRYLRELAYSEGNLCSLALAPPKNPPSAIALCTQALSHMEAAVHFAKPSYDDQMDLANRHGWLGDAYLASGDYERAREQRSTQERILQKLIDADPRNKDLRSFWIAVQRILAWMDAKAGHVDAALARIRAATAVVGELISLDPTNRTWLLQRDKLSEDTRKISATLH